MESEIDHRADCRPVSGTGHLNSAFVSNPESQRDTGGTDLFQDPGRSNASVLKGSASSFSTDMGSGVLPAAGQSQVGRPKKATKRVAPPPPTNTKPIPCPRCHSEATKFCYYNNYDPQQPRYYCKDCQRYWTVGGVLRNVPPGSGRRKSRSAASREGRKQTPQMTTTTTTTATTQEGEGTGSMPQEGMLPADLLNSNPLASVLISNLGLASPEVAFRAAPRPGDSASLDASNQTSDTTQRLGTGVGALPSASMAAPMQHMLFTGPLVPQMGPAMAAAGGALPTAPLASLNGRGMPAYLPPGFLPFPQSVAPSMQASAKQDAPTSCAPCSADGADLGAVKVEAQPATATASRPPAVLGTASTAFSTVPAPYPFSQAPATNTQPVPATTSAAFSSAHLQSSQSGPATTGSGSLPAAASQGMANMAHMAPAIQMLIAQNAAATWLNSQPRAAGADIMAGMSMLPPGFMPGLPPHGGFFPGHPQAAGLPYLPMLAGGNISMGLQHAAGGPPGVPPAVAAAANPTTSAATMFSTPPLGSIATPATPSLSAISQGEPASQASLQTWLPTAAGSSVTGSLGTPPLFWAPTNPPKGAFDANAPSMGASNMVKSPAESVPEAPALSAFAPASNASAGAAPAAADPQQGASGTAGATPAGSGGEPVGT